MPYYTVTYHPFHQAQKPWRKRRDKTVRVMAGNVIHAEQIVHAMLRKGRPFRIAPNRILSIVPSKRGG